MIDNLGSRIIVRTLLSTKFFVGNLETHNVIRLLESWFCRFFVFTTLLTHSYSWFGMHCIVLRNGNMVKEIEDEAWTTCLKAIKSPPIPISLLCVKGIEGGFGLAVVGKAQIFPPYSFGLLSHFMECNYTVTISKNITFTMLIERHHFTIMISG